MTMTNEREILKEKFNFYLKSKTLVHIKLANGLFRNGVLVEKESEEVYVLSEKVLGLMHIFLSEVIGIDEYTEVRK